MAGKARGEMCNKHPQLEGLRYLPGWNCVDCVKENNKRLYKLRTVEMPKELAELRKQVEEQQQTIAELERADECWLAVITYMLGPGRDQEPMEFLRQWNAANFDVLREEWPDAPEEIYLADASSVMRHS